MATPILLVFRHEIRRSRHLIPTLLALGLVLAANGCVFDQSGAPYDVTGDATVGPDTGDGGAALCGNGTIDQGEDCDGDEFDNQTCGSLGFLGGELTCAADCLISTAGCSNCGNDQQEEDEHCDGVDLAGQTCVGLGFDGGNLSCGPDCTFETNLCTGSGCGDGVIDVGEECDGIDLGGSTCASLWHDGGNLVCAADCTFDVSDCTDCGDGVAEGNEACDQADLAGRDCVDEGFEGGSLTCDLNCAFDTTSCATCGNNQIEGSEECDDGGANSNTVPDACRMSCTHPTCGDGVCDTGDPSGCPQDCRVILFADDFDGAWPNGWSTGDNLEHSYESGVDTWEPATNAAHSGTYSLWCAGEGNQSSNYDNYMESWAVHTVDLSFATGTIHYDLWLWLDLHNDFDYFVVTYNNSSGWGNLESFDADNGGWTHLSYDISFGAGNPNFQIGLYFDSNFTNNSGHGAYVDDIVVWYQP